MPLPGAPPLRSGGTATKDDAEAPLYHVLWLLVASSGSVAMLMFV
jgi:hypothetical protein